MATATQKPRTRTTAASADSAPSVTEELAADAASDKVEYPEGAPELLPVLALPRLKRADYYEAMSAVAVAQKATKLDAFDDKAGDRPVEVKLTQMAGFTRLVGAIEDLLAIVAVDLDAFRAWSAKVPDAELVQLFNAYQAATQPGEASSSAS